MTSADALDRVILSFDDNKLLPLLVGHGDRHLLLIEERLGSRINARGNELKITGFTPAVRQTEAALNALWGRLKRALPVDQAEVEAAIRTAMTALDDASREAALAAFSGARPSALTDTLRLSPRSATQGRMMEAMATHEMVFAIGPAGTGKTFLAVAQAVAMLRLGRVKRLVISRPAVEAGERLGFLPGDMKEKVDPYLRPIYDALHALMPKDKVTRAMENGSIEIAPLAFMRGRTLSDSFVILDEAQNTTPMQMKMILTRLGEGSQMVVTGDPSQVDLPPGQVSGLDEAVRILEGVNGIAFIRFATGDVVRHPLVGRILQAYDQDRTRLGRDAARPPAPERRPRRRDALPGAASGTSSAASGSAGALTAGSDDAG